MDMMMSVNLCKSGDFTPSTPVNSRSFSNVRMRCDMHFPVLDSSCLGAFTWVKCLCKTLMSVAAVHWAWIWREPTKASLTCAQVRDGWSNCVFKPVYMPM